MLLAATLTTLTIAGLAMILSAWKSGLVE